MTRLRYTTYLHMWYIRDLEFSSTVFNVAGFWFFHCHIEFHVDIGMGLILQVGNMTDMPQTPKNFPKCGNWKFQGYDTDDEEKPITCGAARTTTAVIILAFLGLFLTRIAPFSFVGLY